ncbi:hypothetical protein CFK37_19665 [Virgibacillus phasianinus]|uniref:Replicative helicase inhibitor G39P N-terminal domain-containing protein n=1 Tax=Virgibacillus phasianinus TaxID=2017483 RepID=A0A220U847_9BACI|nr:hypothetical protein [Virgibacillus phasianinus]ASK64205.1 hypothetical protein CFK37_19665 [Virgibacillus phasianinus]
MNQQEAIHVLETIGDIYPKFEVSKQKAHLLIQQLIQMDYDLVMEKLSAYVGAHAFAPTLAEIAAYPPVCNDHLENITRWRAEAATVPTEVKRAFHQKLTKLLKDKTNHGLS